MFSLWERGRPVSAKVWLLASLALVSCVSTGQPTQPVTLPPEEGAPKVEPLPPPPATRPADASEVDTIAFIENAFARNDCGQVLDAARSMEISLEDVKNPNLPPWVGLALAICEAERAPNDAARALLAQRVIERTENQHKSLLGTAWSRRLSAQRYRAAKDWTNLRATLEAEKQARHEENSILPRLQAEILLLEDGVQASLDSATIARIQDAAAKASQENTLIQAQDVLDRLIADVQNTQAKNHLIAMRARVAGMLEEAYQIRYLRALVAARAGNMEEAHREANTLERFFHGPAFAARTKALQTRLAGGQAKDMNFSTQPAEETAPADGTTTPEQTLTAAREALDNGEPGRAVTLLDSIAPEARDNRVLRLRTEAANRHVMDLRLRVSRVYKEAQALKRPPEKLRALEDARETLKEILSRYPDTTSRPGVERNLRAIENEIEALRKGN